MAGQLSRLPVEFGVVFPSGAFVASVSMVRDFDAPTAGEYVQARGKDTGELRWQVGAAGAAAQLAVHPPRAVRAACRRVTSRTSP
jgi:hypothetical protein